MRSDNYLLSQTKYASGLLAYSRITGSNTTPTPFDPNVNLTPFDGVPFEDANPYRQLVGNLIYFTRAHLDIAYAVHIVSQFINYSLNHPFYYCFVHSSLCPMELQSMDFNSLLSYLLCYMSTLLQIRLEIQQMNDLQQVTVST
ncbi:putative mitochondrial protein [Cucumis melo var. makuwa]|uniref:Mitochondrial protein n=1 Tax=Cucumis melo var. makuwa TaxID=1194695 RepID=A0A5A7VJC1_CUCMM|nr:putative mitochondrial protein [Cucumis melo var. makuwa]